MTKTPGSIWYAKVYYEDDSEVYKERPVVVLSENCCICLGLKVTSKLHHTDSYQLMDWKEANLTKASAVRLNGFVRIPDDHFSGYVGELSSRDWSNLYNELVIHNQNGRMKNYD